MKLDGLEARDLSVAFFLVATTYIFIAAMFFMFFPGPKSCIADV